MILMCPWIAAESILKFLLGNVSLLSGFVCPLCGFGDAIFEVEVNSCCQSLEVQSG